MAAQKLKTKLKGAWNKILKSEKLVSIIKTKNNGEFKFGVKLYRNKPQYFAYNITLDKPIKAEVKEKKVAGTDFIIQLNEFRALRPGGERPHIGRQPDISKLASKCRFFCGNKKNPLSLLNRKVLHQEKGIKYDWNYFYNAFPFMADGHFMLVPTTKKGTLQHLPQKMTEHLASDLIKVFEKSEGLINIYQSMHAGATVNHFHLHTFFHTRRYAIEKAKVLLNKIVEYPADAFVYELNKHNEIIWQAINILQKHKIPFDLVNMKKKVYIFPRHPMHEVVSEFPDGGIGANELMGVFVTTSKTTYKKLTKTKLINALKKTTLEI